MKVMMNLIEIEYPNEDLNNIKRLCELLNKEFDTDFTESDIIDHHILSLEEEDSRLQYKHLNLAH